MNILALKYKNSNICNIGNIGKVRLNIQFLNINFMVSRDKFQLQDYISIITQGNIFKKYKQQFLILVI